MHTNLATTDKEDLILDNTTGNVVDSTNLEINHQWIIDSGATNHMVVNLSFFISKKISNQKLMFQKEYTYLLVILN